MTCKVKSVVSCKNGYQACVEKRMPLSQYPHFEYVLRYAKGATIEEAIRNAEMHGVALTARKKKVEK